YRRRRIRPAARRASGGRRSALQLPGPQLATRGIDVEPTGGANRRRDPGCLQHSLKLLGARFRRRGERAALDRVHRDQVDVTEAVVDDLCQPVRLLNAVVDALEQDVLITDAATGALGMGAC